jgi:predicted acyltransferase
VRDQILVGLGFVVVSAVVGYFGGTWLRSRPKWYRPTFVAIVVLGVVAIALGLVGGREFAAAAAIGTTFGLLNGVRHGFTRPFDGLTVKGGSGERP